LRISSKFLRTNRGRGAVAALLVFCAAGIGLGIGENGRAAAHPLEIRTASLPQASVNLSYSETLKAAGGENPYQWKIAAGKLPKGLTLNTSGALAGTPFDSGTFPITVTVNDTGNPVQTAQKDFSLTVDAVSGLQLTTAALPQANPAADYTSILSANGGVAPYKWSVISGNLPSTLTLAPTGTITGVISQPGTYQVLLEVKDSGNPSQTVQKNFNLVVGGAQSGVYLPAPGSATAPSPYSSAPTPGSSSQPRPYPPPSAGTASRPYPPGAAPGPSAVPRPYPPGPPTASRASSTTATPGPSVTPRPYPSSSTSAPRAPASPYPLASMPGPAATTHDGFRIVTPGLPPGQQSAAYSLTLEAEGGQSPYRWSLLSNRLPPGLRLNPSGSVTGTPNAAGVYTFTLRATDSSEAPISAAQVYQLKIVPPDSAGAGAGAAPTGASEGGEAPRGPALQLEASQLPDGQVSEAYSAAVTVTGGLRPYAWTVASGALPSGLTLDPAKGQIQGAAAATGTFSFVVEVSDSSSPGQVVRQSYSIVIAALGAGSQ
jgi:hypothetical protein